MGNVWQAIKDALHSPFSTPLDTVHIFLIVGVIMIAALMWGRVLAHVTAAAREL